MKRRALTMSRQLISRIVSVCAAAFLLAACHAPALEDEIQLPDNQEPVAVSERATIPFSLKVSTEATKVSYDGGSYQFKKGDKLHVQGVTRTDIEGDLTQNGDVWSGNLSYSGDVPEDNTALKVTLIHADNTDTKTYASAIVGSGNVTGEVTTAKLLQYAVEHYSLFTAEDATTKEDVTFETESAILKQQATFLDVMVTFEFDGTHEMGEGGDAKVDLVTTRGETKADVAFTRIQNTPNYKVHFMAVVPGGETTDTFTLTVGDREVKFKDKPTLLCNKKYTVDRTIVYQPQVGDPFWSDGTYGKLGHPDSNEGIVGIVVYVNHNYTETEKAAIDDAITEKDAGWGHGLVMALHNVTAGTGNLWGSGNNAGGVKWSLQKGTQLTSYLVTSPKQALGLADGSLQGLNGLANTGAIVTALGNNNSAAYLAQQYPVTVSTTHTSGWFLPSIGQWIYTISIDGFGGADHASQWVNTNGENWLTKGIINNLVCVMENGSSNKNRLVESLNNRMADFQARFAPNESDFYDAFGMTVNNVDGDNYWTSSEYSGNNALRMNLGSVEIYNGKKYTTIKTASIDKNQPYAYAEGFIMKVRPFLVF